MPGMHLTDEELIQKARLKDKQAFTELVDRYSDKILGYLYRYIGDYHLAEDLTIETFLNAYNSLEGYEEMGKFSSWLYRIATNCAKKELRKRKAHAPEISLETPAVEDGSVTLGELIADESSRPDYNLRAKELKEGIYKVMAKLDKKYREVLLLCDVEGLSYEDAAKSLRSIPRTVGTRLKRARKMLYDLLKKHGFEF